MSYSIKTIMQEKYVNLIKKHEPCLKETEARENIIGWLKLTAILGLALPLSLAIGIHIAFSALFIVVFAAIFFVAMKHQKLRKKVDYLGGVIKICERHIDRTDGKWTSFSDAGAEYKDDSHAYSSDLDIAGNKSLFQFLNTTNTWHGRTAFSKDLMHSNFTNAELKERQHAVKELSQDIEASCDIQYHFSKVGVDGNVSALVEELQKKDVIFMKSKFLRFLLMYVPFAALAGVGALFILRPPYFAFYILLMLIASAVVTHLGLKKTRSYFGTMLKISSKLEGYAEVVKILTAKNYSCKKLNSIREQLTDAAAGISKLDSIASMVKGSGIGLNFLLWWNYRCAFALQDWKQKYRDRIGEWLLVLGELESLLALSHLPNLCSNTCLPTFSQECGKISAKDMGHPLLQNKRRINNDVEFDSNILIISGSNMSGKTTFLRTIGINIVLARAGGFVCAKEFTCTLFDVMTSMRIADDLNEGVSTFYAELKRIKGIIDFAKKPRVLFLIDEIFRGTNSVDRLSGARTVIKELEKLGSSGLVSTHDLELCELEKINKRITNLHFCEHYKDNQIHFDYKLKQGKSTTTNAKHLMEMVGIVVT